MSVPAMFRQAVAKDAFQGVVVFRSFKYPALEGMAMARLEQLSQGMEKLGVFSDTQDDLVTSVFADAVPLPFDSEGRIILPQALVEHAGIQDDVTFVGRGQMFQIWQPHAFAKHQAAARQRLNQLKPSIAVQP